MIAAAEIHQSAAKLPTASRLSTPPCPRAHRQMTCLRAQRQMTCPRAQRQMTCPRAQPADDPARRPSLPWQPAATLGGYSFSSAVEQRAWEPSFVSPILVAEIGSGRHGVVALAGLVDDALRAELLGELLGDASTALLSVTPPSSRWERTTIDGVEPLIWDSFGTHLGLLCTRHDRHAIFRIPY
jgi:hypothetical protein